MLQTSISLGNLWWKVYVHSVANFSNKCLKINSLQKDFKFLCVYICSVMYSIVSLIGVNKDSKS